MNFYEFLEEGGEFQPQEGQAHNSQPQGDMEEGNGPGQSIPATNRKNPYQTTRS